MRSTYARGISVLKPGASAGWVVLLVATPCLAQSVSLSPTADTFVTSALPDRNFGGAGAFAMAAPGLPRGEAQTMLRFDTAAARTSFDTTFGVGGWTVSGLTLRMTAAMPNNDVFNTSAAGQIAVRWTANDTWVEGTGTPGNPTLTGLTFNSLPTFLSANDQDAGTFAFGGETSGTRDYPVSVTSGSSGDVLAGGLLSLRLFAADAVVAAMFNSRTNGMPANRPVLLVTAAPIPEPASISLIALASCAILRRRCGRRLVSMKFASP